MVIKILIGILCLSSLMQGQVSQRPLEGIAQAEDLTRTLCDLEFGIPVVRSAALGKVRHTGGWFAINALSQFLENDPQFTKGDYDNFGMYASRQFYALQILPQIVPDPPLGPPSGLLALDPSREALIWRSAVWKKWLKVNHARLASLEPRGEGIIVSHQVCRDVWKRDIQSVKELYGDGEFSMLQITLAREGEPEQLQQLACEADYGSRDVQYNAIEKLRSVSGWFSIKLLSDLAGYSAEETSQPRSVDAVEVHALEALFFLPPNSPFPESYRFRTEDYSKNLMAWKEWFDKNHESLKNMPPTGEGIMESAEVCQRALKDDLAARAYQKQ
jgi:hypothetical protein